jgi:hypothetical protein
MYGYIRSTIRARINDSSELTDKLLDVMFRMLKISSHKNTDKTR